MTAKLILLTGLLFALNGQAQADQAPPPADGHTAQAAAAPTTPAPQAERLAWQRVGAPLSLAG
ncbi:MAG: hypothetical protein AB1831_05975 [Pseudomonadota bacterium]